MNRHVNAIAGRLSLRPPQRRSLEILDRVTEIAPPRKGADVEAALVAIRSEFPSVADFERDFPSLCFALATGVGKTRLMGCDEPLCIEAVVSTCLIGSSARCFCRSCLRWLGRQWSV